MDIKRTTIAAVCALFLSSELHAADRITMEDAFRAQDWNTVDAIALKIESTSLDFFPDKFEPKDASLYINSLWRRSKYQEALSMIDRYAETFPKEIAPYAEMLKILGSERTGRKDDAFSLGNRLWDDAPYAMRYYLAFAMGRIARDTSRHEDALKWFRTMLAYATDKRSRIRALEPLVSLPGATAEDAALLLIERPSDQRALEMCRAAPAGSSTRVQYALGMKDWYAKKYSSAVQRLASALSDPEFGESARYYRGYAAFRANEFETAFNMWSSIVLQGSEFPQRSISRLRTLATKAKKQDILSVFKKAAESRTDFSDVMADALVAIADLGSDSERADARRRLNTEFKATQQAATLCWDDGWKAWGEGRTQAALDTWLGGYSSDAKNRELGARLLYWISRAYDKLGKKDDAARARGELSERFPAEYYTFLVDPRGGITDGKISDALTKTSELEEWGFMTYARLEAARAASLSDDIEALARAVRLAAWEGDHSASVRSAITLVRKASPSDASSAELLRLAYPRPFEQDVAAASAKNGLDKAYIWGIMRQESMYEPDVTSSAGAYGLMQLMPATARGEEERLKMAKGSYKIPASNIMIGAHYFVGQLAAFKQSAPLALAAYNAGGGRVRQWTKEGVGDMPTWIENIPFRETRGYVKAVMRNYNVYKVLYDK